jgi:uncharacterized protein (TIRG00374 family)
MQEDTASHAAVPAKKPSWQRQLIQGVITLAVLVLVFGFVIPRLADYEAVLDYVGGVSIAQWSTLVILAAAVLIAYMFVLVSAMRTLRFREAYVAQTTAQAVNNTLPAGGAIALPLQYATYLSWGFTPESVTAMFLSVGTWDQFARFGLPILALAVTAFTQSTPWWTWAVAIGGIAVIGIALRIVEAVFSSEEAARRLGGLIERTVNRVLGLVRRRPMAVATSVMQFRANAIDVVQRRWRQITVTTIVNHLVQLGLFLTAIRAVGITRDDIPTVWVIAAFAVGRLLTMIPVSPGGLGLVDLGWIGLLALGWQTGNADQDAITAGTLLFRALTYFPPILLGGASWVVYRVKGSWRRDWQTARRGEWERVSG